MHVQTSSTAVPSPLMQGHVASYGSFDGTTLSLNDRIILHVLPHQELSWARFLTVTPPYSIALDGVVKWRPDFDRSGKRLNFDHHEGVNRSATQSAAYQVMRAIEQGLLDISEKCGNRKINVYINHPDQDSCLAVWLLANHALVLDEKYHSAINSIVDLENKIDTAGGAYNLSFDLHLARQMAWIFEPFVNEYMSGHLKALDADGAIRVVQSVSQRITAHVQGIGTSIDLDTSHEVLGQGKGWAMIREIGYYARSAIFKPGCRELVCYRGECANGMHHYSLIVQSQFSGFKLERACPVLNKLENLDPMHGLSWGMCGLVGGSPRGRGSKFGPKELTEIINNLDQ